MDYLANHICHNTNSEVDGKIDERDDKEHQSPRLVVSSVVDNKWIPSILELPEVAFFGRGTAGQLESDKHA